MNLRKMAISVQFECKAIVRRLLLRFFV